QQQKKQEQTSRPWQLRQCCMESQVYPFSFSLLLVQCVSLTARAVLIRIHGNWLIREHANTLFNTHTHTYTYKLLYANSAKCQCTRMLSVRSSNCGQPNSFTFI
ncbi:unnamed protein product, partial [Ceratitis capitata]